MKAISAFDLDKTLLSVNSSYLFGLSLCKKKHLPFKSLAFILGVNLSYSLGFLSIEELHQSAFNNLFFKRSSLLVKEWANHFIDETYESLLYLPAIEKLIWAQKNGHLTAILSSSPDFLVEAIAAKLNVPVWHGTEYAIDENQNYSKISRLILGEDKALILNELAREYGIEKENIYAYSDSHIDLSFLMAAGSAIGVQPNRKLRRICHQNNWPII